MFSLLFTFGYLWMGVTCDLISREKPTVSSSAWESWNERKTVDGNYNGDAYKESCLYTDTDAVPFLIVDLQGTFIIDRVVIYNRVDYKMKRIIGAIVQLLSETDQLLHECGKISESLPVLDVVCGYKVAQKVRVIGVTLQNLQICELEVHGEPVVSLLSRGKPTYQTSVKGDMDGSLAVDGRYENYVNKDDVLDLRNCFISEQEEMSFLDIDLKGLFAIDRVTLFNRVDCCSENMVGAVVELLYANGQLIYECGNVTESKKVYNISCGNNLAEKIRIVGAPHEYLQLCEVDVYGKPQSLPQVISRKKPTNHSSVYASLNSSMAVDGLYNNMVDSQGVLNLPVCFQSLIEKVPFMEVDLKGKFKIDYIIIYNRIDCLSDKIVGAVIELISIEGSILYQCGNITSTQSTYTISCGSKSAYKVRVTAKPNTLLTICELEVYGKSMYKVRSRGKPTTTSSVYDGLGGSFAVDGIYEYNFHDANDINMFHSKIEEEPFWEVSLQEIFIVDKVVIYNRIDCCLDRLVNTTVQLVTETGGVSYECGTITEAKAVYTVSCASNVAFKVRIKGPAHQYLHFTEVDVYTDYAD